MNLSTTQLRMLGSVLYFAAAVLILNFFAQFTITTWPFRASELNWRVGSTGLFMDVLLSSIVPMAMIHLAAFMNGDRKTLHFLRWLSLLIGVATLVLLGLFALDAVQIRPQLNQNMKGQFMKVSMRAGLVGVMVSTLFVWLGLTMGKVLKSQGTVRTVGKESPQEQMLMVGTREPSRPNLRSIDGLDAKKEAKKEGTGGFPVDA